MRWWEGQCDGGRGKVMVEGAMLWWEGQCDQCYVIVKGISS